MGTLRSSPAWLHGGPCSRPRPSPALSLGAATIFWAPSALAGGGAGSGAVLGKRPLLRVC